MKTSFKFFGLLVLWVMVALPISGQTLEKSLLWEISGKGLSKPSYLFGTYHLLTNEYLEKEHPGAFAKFKASENVVVEMVIDTPAMMKSQMHMLMLQNKLSALLDSATYRLLKNELEEQMGVDAAMFEQVKPMAINTILSMRYAQAASPELSQYGGVPMDLYFARQGAATRKNITALETVEEQMIMLYDHFSIQEQALQLTELLANKDKNLSISAELVGLYRDKNIQGMYDIGKRMEQEMPSFGSLNFLTVDRNKPWSQKLPSLMQAGSQFIAVGALHLPGPDGLIDLLRKQGYTVRPVL